MEPTDRTTTAATGVAPPGAPPPGGVTSAATARAYAESVARARWHGSGRGVREEDVVDLLLVVSELVTNAIRHGDGLAGFEVRTTDDGMWIAVHDHSAVVPRAAYAFPTQHRGSGYGWPLVARLARDIAVEPRPGGGKTISVLVPLRGARA
ncbi:ATP-binding protein [Streptomyces sp. AC627_RSS907]|uniref:ATP-binding protein n=1 Tax=Streptomyces sp. AC627_RSS907 TaxID=2823684 RepID=UPI001C22613C|nr:ATP-binding protein [Streptomyces sp. AC627_RSS907]